MRYRIDPSGFVCTTHFVFSASASLPGKSEACCPSSAIQADQIKARPGDPAKNVVNLIS